MIKFASKAPKNSIVTNFVDGPLWPLRDDVLSLPSPLRPEGYRSDGHCTTIGPTADTMTAYV